MKQTIYYLLLSASMLVSGCNSELEPEVSEGEPVSLTASMEEETRAVGTRWETGDRIGVSVDGSKGTQYLNTLYTVRQGGTTGTLDYSGGHKIYFKPGETYSVFAYYPFSGLTDLLNSHEVSVTSQTDQKAIDILGCLMTNVPNTQTSLDLAFKHYMARVNIIIKPGSNMTFDDLKSAVWSFRSISVSGRLNGDRTGFEASGNPVSWTFSNHTNPVDDVSAKTRTYTLIVPPPRSTDDKSLTLECQYNGEVKTCTFSMNRAAGTTQNVEVTLSQTDPLKVSTVTPTNWSENKNQTVN